MEFASPYFLLLLLLLPLWWWWRRYVRRSTLTVSNATIFTVTATWKTRLSGAPMTFLRLIILALLIIALARPRQGMEQIIERKSGIAIEMVLDRSGSMSEKMKFRGKNATRFAVAKAVFQDFVIGDGKMSGRANDLIGLIVYARYADTICPLTLAHEALPQFLAQIEIVDQRNEDGTAIGDALALAAARLQRAEKNEATLQTQNDDYIIKSKIIILLTDGLDNSSRTPPENAAKMCQDWGIKVYTIALGGSNEQNYINTPLGKIPLGGGGEIDTTLLKKIAQITGGKFYLADNEQHLQAIYADIDQLEKTEIEAIRFADYAEKFLPFVFAALLLLLVEILLRGTILRVNS